MGSYCEILMSWWNLFWWARSSSKSWQTLCSVPALTFKTPWGQAFKQLYSVDWLTQWLNFLIAWEPYAKVWTKFAVLQRRPASRYSREMPHAPPKLPNTYGWWKNCHHDEDPFWSPKLPGPSFFSNFSTLLLVSQASHPACIKITWRRWYHLY
jgi:hypothetical protein